MFWRLHVVVCFRCLFQLCENMRADVSELKQMQEQTNAPINTKNPQCIVGHFFFIILMILGVREPPGGSSEEGTQKGFKKLSDCVHFGTLFRISFALKSDFCVFVVCSFLCLLLASLLGRIRQQFHDFEVISGSILGTCCNLFCRCYQTQKVQLFRAKYLVWEVLGLRFCVFLLACCMCFLCCCLDSIFVRFS